MSKMWLCHEQQGGNATHKVRNSFCTDTLQHTDSPENIPGYIHLITRVAGCGSCLDHHLESGRIIAYDWWIFRINRSLRDDILCAGLNS